MKLLIVEDEEDLVAAMAKGLRQQGYAVDTAYDGEGGELLAQINKYDLLILDLNLPCIDGIEVCRRLRAAQPSLPILMLTARAGLHDRIKGLDAGGDDYLIKPFHFAELLARLRALLRRNVSAREPLLRNGDLQLDLATKAAWHGDHLLKLTLKEFAVLEYLLRHAGEVVSQEDLLEHVWDMNADLFTNAVRVHINSLRRKLHDNYREPHYIETVIGGGYRLLVQEQKEADR